MCEPTTIVLAISAVVGAVTAISAGQQQQKAANAQAQEALNQGAYRQDEARQRAEKIRRAGLAQRGEAKAALAAGGVKLGEGTALEIDKTIATRSEEDALSAILTGKRAGSSARSESDLLKTAGENAANNSYGKAASTVLQAGSTYVGSGWIKTKPQGALYGTGESVG
jgi:type II secretory pathway pseudopilin PulG